MNESKPKREHYGCAGAVSGGCLLPVLLLFVAALLGDTGGPLFWPIFALFLAVLGGCIGTFIRRNNRSD
jgi:uncharacterized membrane protein